MGGWNSFPSVLFSVGFCIKLLNQKEHYHDPISRDLMGKSQNGKSLLPRHRPWSKLLLPNHRSGNFVPGSVLTPWPDSQMKRLLFCVRQYKFLNLRRAQAALKYSYTHDLTNVGYHKPLCEVQGQVPEIAHRVKWLTVKITCKIPLRWLQCTADLVCIETKQMAQV